MPATVAVLYSEGLIRSSDFNNPYKPALLVGLGALFILLYTFFLNTFFVSIFIYFSIFIFFFVLNGPFELLDDTISHGILNDLIKLDGKLCLSIGIASHLEVRAKI